MSEVSHTDSEPCVLADATTRPATTPAAEATIVAPASVHLHDTTTSSAALHANIDDTLSTQAQLDTPNLSPKPAPHHAYQHDTANVNEDDGNTNNHDDNHSAMSYLHRNTEHTIGRHSTSSPQPQLQHSPNDHHGDALATPSSVAIAKESDTLVAAGASTTPAAPQDHIQSKAADLQPPALSSSSSQPSLSTTTTPLLSARATFAEAESPLRDDEASVDDGNSRSSSASASPLRVSIPPKLTSTLPLAKRKSRIDPESKIGRRLAMMAEGRNENGRDLPDVPLLPADQVGSGSNKPSVEDDMADLPDGSEFPDSFWDEILRQDQTTVSRSATTMPKKSSSSSIAPKTPTSAPITTVPWRSTSFVNPLTGNAHNNMAANSTAPSSHAASRQTSFASLSTKPSFDTVNGNSIESTPTTPGEELNLGAHDPQMELKVLQLELLRTKDGKVKAEEDAKNQRAAVMSLKTEVQFVRNVLKRRETELGDVKEMSSAYETELSGLREKLGQAERQLAKGNGELEAKIRALERLRDESFERIKVLDEKLKTLKETLADLEKRHAEADAENKMMKAELEELAPLREELEKRKEEAARIEAEENAKIRELTAQIRDLEDTRDCHAAVVEELEAKLKTVETEAQEFKSKAELEYEALSEGFKELKTRRSEEIKALRVELEQHKLQEQIIEKLQADIDQLQEALNTIASSHSSENARLNQVTAELNEALAEKDEEVRTVRQNLTEFEESHSRLVASLHDTLATINDEAEAARKSRDEAVTALESLREELEALRHTLPINQKHMSLSQWSEEQQKLQQEQLKVIEDLESKVHGQVDGVKEGQQRASELEANTKRKSQQLVEILEQHLQLSNAIVSSQTAAEAAVAQKSSIATSKKSEPLSRPLATIPVRTMLNYLTQLRAIALEGKPLEQDQDNVDGASNNMEEHLKAFLATLEDEALMEPWVREKELESEISQLQSKIEALLADAKQLKEDHAHALRQERKKRGEPLSEDEEAEEEARIVSQEAALTEKTRLLQSKELFLKEREDFLTAKEQEIQLWEQARLRREGSMSSSKDGDSDDQAAGAGMTSAVLIPGRRQVRYPATPPLSAGASPFGSPGNPDLLTGLIAAHRENQPALSEHGDSDNEGSTRSRPKDAEDDKATEQEKLIAALQAKIAQLEAQALQGQPKEEKTKEESDKDSEDASGKDEKAAVSDGEEKPKDETAKSGSDDEEIAAFPPPPQRRTLTRAGSIPRLSVAPEGSGWRASTYLSGLEIESFSSNGMVNPLAPHGGAPAAVTAANHAKMEHLENELAMMKDENHELLARLEAIETELELARQQPAELEEQLALVTETAEQQEDELLELRAQSRQQSATLDRLKGEFAEMESKMRGLEGLKKQLEMQVEQERRAKDEATRVQEHLRQELEEEKQKKKGGFLCF
ncbi:hypothetical protein BGZ73_000252 [Actinomortierella ambigua]|nr:hypothetical protein BGZ73_000252 [Actinomortierella ambigua]